MPTPLYQLGETPVTIRDPETSLEVPHQLVGATVRTLDGTLRMHIAGEKLAWNVEWLGLTTAEATAIMVELRRRVPMTWSPPNTVGTYTIVVPGDIDYRPDGFSHAVSARLEEV
jgi:hypothetical protein